MPSYIITSQYGTSLSAPIEATDGATALAVFIASGFVSDKKSSAAYSDVVRNANIGADGAVTYWRGGTLHIAKLQGSEEPTKAPVESGLSPADTSAIRTVCADAPFAIQREGLTDAQVGAVYLWALETAQDCQWGDVDPGDIENQSPSNVVRFMGRHYDGGLAAMVSDALADFRLYPVSTARKLADTAPAICPVCSQSLAWHDNGKPCSNEPDKCARCCNPADCPHSDMETLTRIDPDWRRDNDPIVHSVRIDFLPIEELELGVRAYNIVKRHGISSCADLACVTIADANEWALVGHSLGLPAARQIMQAQERIAAMRAS